MIKYYRYYYVGGFHDRYMREEISREEYLKLGKKGIPTNNPKITDKNFGYDYIKAIIEKELNYDEIKETYNNN